MRNYFIGVIENKWRVFLFSVTVSLIISICGLLYYQYENNLVFKNEKADLKDNSSVITARIVNWNDERINDINIFSHTPVFKNEFKNIITPHKTPLFSAQFNGYLNYIKNNSYYDEIILANNKGRILYPPNYNQLYLDSSSIKWLKKCSPTEAVHIANPKKNTSFNEITLDYIKPVFDGNRKLSGALILRINPENKLFPIIMQGSYSGKKYNVYLVRRKNNRVLCLNEVNYLNKNNQYFSVSINNSELPISRAALGYTGFFEGRDLNGNKVLSYLSPVKGTDWKLILQINKSEAFAVLYYKETVSFIIAIILIAVLISGMMWIYHYRQRNIYRELLKAEKELSEYHEEFKTILLSIGDGLLIIDNDGNVKLMNSTAEMLTGWSLKNAAGKPIEEVFNIINEETLRKVENPFRKVLSQGAIVGLANHTLLISKDGRHIPIADSAAPVRNEKGDIEGVVLVFRDKTDEHIANMLIRQSEARLKRAEIASKSGNWELHLDTNVMYYSAGAQVLYGVDAGPQMYEAVKINPLPEYRQMLDTALKNLIENDIPYNLEFKIRTSDTGQIRDIHSIAEFDKDKKVLFGVIRDITERKIAENSLRESEERFRKIFEEHSAVKLLIDVATSRIVDANKAALNYYGWTKDEMLQLSVNDLNTLHPDEINNELKKAAAGEKNYFQFKHKLKDGSERYVEVYSSKINIRGREFLHSIVFDVTDRKLMEEQVHRNWLILQLFVEHAPASIAMFDKNMVYMAASKRFLVDYELGDINIIGKSHYEIFPEIPERWKEIHRRCLAGATESCDEDPFPRASGKTDWVHWEIRPWYEREGEIGGILLFSEVITERILTQEALRKTGRILNETQILAKVGGWEYDLRSKEMSYSDEVYNIFGIGRDTVLSPEESLKFYHPDDKPLAWHSFTNLIKKGIEYSIEVRIISAGGENLWVRIHGKPEYEDGKYVRVFGNIIDITERKNAEESIRESEARYRMLVDNAPIPVVVTSLSTGRILYHNNNFAVLFGFTGDSDEVGEHFISEFYYYFSQRDDLLAVLKRDGRINSFEIELKTLPGKHITALISSVITTFNGEAALFTTFYDISDRKLAEEDLRRFFNLVPDMVCIASAEGSFIELNNAWQNVLGYSADEMINKSVFDFVHPDDIEPTMKEVQKQLSGNYTLNFVNRYRAKNGEYKTFEWVASPSPDGEKLYAAARDITERAGMMNNLLKLSTAVYHSQIIIVITDIEGKIEYVNPKFTEVTGYSFEEVYGLNPRVLKSGYQSKYYYKNLWSTILAGEEWSGVLKNKKKNGELYWEFAKISPVKNEKGEITSFVAVKEDITDKVHKEEELERYREHLEDLVGQKTEQLKKQNIFFRILIDTIPNPVYVEDSEYRFTEINKAFEEFLDIPREQIIGKTMYDVAPLEAAKLSRQYDEDLLAGHSTVVYETFNISKTRGKIPLLVYKASFGLPEEKPEGITALIIDISKQKEMEKTTLEALNKEKELNEIKSNFISIASHEFRTPLTTILSSADLLEAHYKKWTEDKINSHYKKIHEAVNYIITMLDEVLTISRTDRGKIEFQPRSINLDEFCSNIMEQMSMLALPSQKMTYNYNLNYRNINADPGLLTHIFNNLLSNAIKFSPNGGEILFAVDDEDDFIKFTVKDCGIGIPSEELSKLFEPFFRAKNSASIKGTGLGLSIVQRYVEIHNGQISIESSEGQGTTFFIKINKSV